MNHFTAQAQVAHSFDRFRELSETSLRGRLVLLMFKHYPLVETSRNGPRRTELAYRAAREELGLAEPQNRNREEHMSDGRAIANEALQWAHRLLTNPNEVVGHAEFIFGGSHPIYAWDEVRDALLRYAQREAGSST